MAVGGRGLGLVDGGVVPGADDVADLVRDRVHQGRAGVVHDGEGLFRIGANPRGKPAARRIVDDQDHDIGPLLVAQRVHLLERPDTVDHAVEMVEVVALRLGVVDGLGVGEVERDVADAAVAERGVCFLDGVRDQVRLDVDVVGGGLLGVEHHDVDGGLPGSELLALRRGQQRDLHRRGLDGVGRGVSRIVMLVISGRTLPQMQERRDAPRDERRLLLRRLGEHGFVLGRDALGIEFGNRLNATVDAGGLLEGVDPAARGEHAAGAAVVPAHQHGRLARLGRLATPGGATFAGLD